MGSHMPHWLGLTDVPLFISRVRLVRQNRKTFPTARGRWALDSGGFSQLAKPPHRWDLPESEYVSQINLFAEKIGNLDWAAPQDWMCEPHMLHGRSIKEHQQRTVDNFLTLRDMDTAVPIIPVLQGWSLDDYLACSEMYREAGIDLRLEPTVGLGSVCRRQATDEILAVCTAFSDLNLHGFGMKTQGVRKCKGLLTSADSLAWSYGGRRRGTCPQKSKCANCLHWALDWRDNILQDGAPAMPAS